MLWPSVCIEGSSLADFSTLKMEARLSSETSVHTRSTRRHIPEDGILHSHRCENLKSLKTSVWKRGFVKSTRFFWMAYTVFRMKGRTWVSQPTFTSVNIRIDGKVHKMGTLAQNVRRLAVRIIAVLALNRKTAWSVLMGNLDTKKVWANIVLTD
jgi:hypothetical protein